MLSFSATVHWPKSYVREMFTRSWQEANEAFPYFYPAPFVGDDAHRLGVKEATHLQAISRWNCTEVASGVTRAIWSRKLVREKL